MLLSWIVWDPDRVVLFIPGTHHPIVWYGLFFTLGCILGYLLVTRLLLREYKERSSTGFFIIANWSLCKEKILQAYKHNTASWQSFFEKLPLSIKANLDKEDLDKETFSPYIASFCTTICSKKRLFLQKTLDTVFAGSVTTARRLAVQMADRLTTTVLLGIIVGARLGHICFYTLPLFIDSPMDIFKIWEGGLSSHGGVIGITIALFILYKRLHKQHPIITSPLWLLDYLTIPAPLLGFWIRLGNFFNQELVGYPTTKPWGIIFGSPFNGEDVVPRHPVQLYEAFSYLALFVLFYYLWRKRKVILGTGMSLGLMFTLLFSFRFIFEFFKEPQSLIIEESTLLTGQYLSLPLIGIGILLIIRAWRKSLQNSNTGDLYKSV